MTGGALFEVFDRDTANLVGEWVTLGDARAFCEQFGRSDLRHLVISRWVGNSLNVEHDYYDLSTDREKADDYARRQVFAEDHFPYAKGFITSLYPDGATAGNGTWRISHDCPNKHISGQFGKTLTCSGCGQSLTFSVKGGKIRSNDLPAEGESNV